jgi:hypothetical protein
LDTDQKKKSTTHQTQNQKQLKTITEMEFCPRLVLEDENVAESRRPTQKFFVNETTALGDNTKNNKQKSGRHAREGSVYSIQPQAKRP